MTAWRPPRRAGDAEGLPPLTVRQVVLLKSRSGCPPSASMTARLMTRKKGAGPSLSLFFCYFFSGVGFTVTVTTTPSGAGSELSSLSRTTAGNSGPCQMADTRRIALGSDTQE